jgi:hypothetical protein
MITLRERKRESQYGLLRRALTMIEDAYFLIEEYRRRSGEDDDEVKEAMEALKKAIKEVNEIIMKELDELLYELYVRGGGE